MRVAGYVRETQSPAEGQSAFIQSERIRRWILETGHQLVAVCQDIRQAGHALGREGYRALLGIIAAEQVDAIVVAELESLSPDVIVQEVILWDLRARNVPVLSTEPAELEMLAQPPADRSRLLIRDVLARAGEYLAADLAERPTVLPVEYLPTDVVVELLPADEPAAISSGDAAGRVRTS